MINRATAVINQATIGDVIVVVMDAAMATVEDEAIAVEIAYRVLVNILDKLSPSVAQEIVAALGDNGLNSGVARCNPTRRFA